ncbi:MAG: hemerythrin domain-containing protein [Deltaproteobacteria bacterium]|nr:hemerythrin domain-containing protein [Deltaproteobacteria bacterium]
MSPEMPTPSSVSRPRTAAEVGAQHRDEHRELESILQDLHRRAHSGHWADLNEVWSGFCSTFDAHMKAEEDEVFPAYLRDHPTPEAEARIAALIREHQELRALVEAIAMEIQLHEIRASSVDQFITKNREHAIVETQLFYPWMDVLGPSAL